MKLVMKVALFQSRDGHTYPAGDNVEKYCQQDVRITEYVDVTFSELDGAAIQAARARARELDIQYHQAQLNSLLGLKSGT